MKIKWINLCLSCLFLAGCAVTANDVKKDTKIVTQQLDNIDAKVTAADQKIIQVANSIKAASTQPSTPEEYKAFTLQSFQQLMSAHDDLTGKTGAKKSVATAQGRIPAINKNAQKLQDQRDKERDHFIGYKGRVALWSLAGLLAALTIAGFVLSGGNFKLIQAVLDFIWQAIKPVLVAIGHVLTLGLVALTLHMKKHHEDLAKTGQDGKTSNSSESGTNTV